MSFGILCVLLTASCMYMVAAQIKVCSIYFAADPLLIKTLHSNLLQYMPLNTDYHH